MVLESCLQVDPKDRKSAHEILSLLKNNHSISIVEELDENVEETFSKKELISSNYLSGSSISKS